MTATQEPSGTNPHPPATPEFGFVTSGGPAHAYPAADGVRVTKLSVGPYDNNVYVIASDGRAAIVDGAAEPERILALVEGLDVRAIFETHDHSDHVQALAALVERLGCPVHAHPDDRYPVPTRAVADRDRIQVGGADVQVLHTPGHTPGSICLRVSDHLFTGDTLFPGGPGNTGGDKGRFDQIMASLDSLFELPDHTRVSPGHGIDTTIGRERPHVQEWRARGW